jgi:pilus assembly protein FimV
MVILPSTVFSLGVGEIQVKTALNQALRAEIPLYSVKAREIETLTVRLATIKEFGDAGIDRPWVLSKLRFAIKQKADGIPYIEISTKDSVREPFLNFLLDIEWASGRLLREYTILLDPPVMMRQKPAMVSKPKVSEPVVTPAVPAVTPEPEEKLGPPTIEEGEKVKVKAAPPIMAPATKPAVAAAEPAAPATMPEPAPPAESAPEDDLFPRIDIGEGAAPKVVSTPAMAGADSFGPTKDSDTLWSIAKAARPDNAVSIEQAMMAILKANPAAFAEGNINGLRTGVVLRIPEREAMLAMNHQAAFEETRLQHEMWSKVRPQSPTAETIQRKGADKGPAAADVTGKPVQPEVKLVTPSKTTKAGSGAGLAKDLERLQDELALARENLASKDQENTDLQNRVRDLEEQIENMQRLMTLKDDDLARLQEKLAAEQEAAPVPAPEASTAEPAPAETVAATEPQPAPVEAPAPSVKQADGEVNPFAVKEKPAATPEPKPAPVAEAPKPAPAKPKPAPVQDQFEKPSGGIVDDILGNPMMLGVVVVGIIVVLGILWVAIRRRRMSSMEFPESILHGKTATEVPEPSETSSLLTDFTSSAIGESEVGEVDPLAEADVFIAYKRFGQAEEMLKQALTTEPDRDDLKLKLMEVYKETGNREAFDSLAQELHDSLDSQSGALWEKAVALGQSFAPDNPLFGGGIENEMEAMAEEAISDMENLGDTGLTEAEAEEAEALTAGMDLDFETKPEAAPAEDLEEASMETAPEAEAESAEDEFGLDLSSLETAEEEPKAGSSDVDEALSGLDLDLSSLEDMTSEEEPAGTTEETSLEFDTSDLDMGLEESTEAPAAEKETSMDFDLDLSALEETAEPTEEESGLEFDMGGIEAAEEKPAAEVDTSTTDEVATKLDLARAYIDMGDPEGARSILEEVSAEGNDAQKKEAQELIGQL